MKIISRRFYLIPLCVLTGGALMLLATYCNGAETREYEVDAQCRRGEITVTGEAPIYTSIDTARMKARTDACRRAVEKCIGDEVAAASGVADGQSIGSEIFAKAQGICKNDEIVNEEQYTLDTVKMLKLFIRFRVSQAEVQDSIDTMKNLVGNPKVMVMIREEYNLSTGKRVAGFRSTQTKSPPLLVDFLRSRDYTILDSTGVAARINNEEQIATNPSALSASIKDMAAEAGADVLVIGQIQTFPQQISTTGPFKSCEVQGNVKILALWGDGRVMAEYTDRGAGVQVSELGAALKGIEWFTVGKRPEQNVEGLAAWVHRTMANEWAIMTRNNVIRITVNNIDDKEKGVLIDNLKHRTAVRSVDEISYSNGVAVLEAKYPGRAFALADTIGWYGDNPGVFSALRFNCKKISVTDVRRGEITLQLSPGTCGE